KSSTSSSSSAPSAPRASIAPKLTPLLLLLIVGATGVGGYGWDYTLSTSLNKFDSRAAQAQAQKGQLRQIIKENAVYEARKRELENRIKIIEGLKRDQISPLVSLDALAQAIDKTQFVWLNNLDQNNTTFTMSGTGTSVNAIADFVTNLEGTGYFHNVNLVNAQDISGNFSFAMTCEFAPPSRVATAEAA